MTDQSRLASFFLYPYTAGVSAIELSEAGFHYKGQNDEVICRHCGLRYSGWQKGDDPKAIHLQKSSNCPFFQSTESEGVYGVSSKAGNNILSGTNDGSEEKVSDKKTDTQQHINSKTHTTPISSQETGKVQKDEKVFVSDQHVAGHSVCKEDATCLLTTADISNPCSENEAKEEQHEAEHFSRTEDSAAIASPIEAQTVDPGVDNTREDLSDYRHVSEGHPDAVTMETTVRSLKTVPPKYQKFSVLATRLNSYRHWPKHHKQRPEDLAKAGLFYEGTYDYVRCFHCGGGLREWDPEDDPFYEHARWFPFCPFLRLVKGDKYIMGVQSGTIKPTDMKPNDKPKPVHQQESNLFDHPAVLSVMEMGYSKAVLTKAITVYRKRIGTDFTAEMLLAIIWEIQENNIDDIPDDEIVENEEMKSDVTEMRYKSTQDVRRHVTAEGSIMKGIDELTEENRELREQKTCKVCLDEEASIVFLPCGHLVACPMCASALPKCPVCRTYIRGTVKAVIP